MIRYAAGLLLLCSISAFAKPNPPLETAKVISQDLETQDRGTAVMPLGRGVVGVPISRRSNIVLVETASERMTWGEDGNGKNVIILPVHGTIQFYRDGKWFIVMDSSNKKHKFGILHLEVPTEEAK